MQGRKAVPPHRPVCVRPDWDRFTVSSDKLLQRGCSIARRYTPRQSTFLRRKDVTDAVQEEFKQCGAIEPLLS